ncbi:hypothetical protein BKA63DRAFT_556790 [Paraphoma chrysanthemicola]|nr:hypothetical protein BKA63DRAFT_556790 [Paraphoma chrysanthemicola]
MAADLGAVLTPGFLASVHDFWFAHLHDSSARRIVPDVADTRVWFEEDEEFDRECVTRFSTPLATILSLTPTPQAILAATTRSTPHHWLSLILFFDALPRKVYHGTATRMVYTYFDPVAQHIALRAIQLRIPQHPDMRYRHAYRFWFYMPLQHAETLCLHDRVAELHGEMFVETWALVNGRPGSVNRKKGAGDADVEVCRKEMIERRGELEMWERMLKRRCEEYREVVRRFGRFPDRNGVLGRVATGEEEEYLRQREGGLGV